MITRELADDAMLRLQRGGDYLTKRLPIEGRRAWSARHDIVFTSNRS
jgi:hypothetical protein